MRQSGTLGGLGMITFAQGAVSPMGQHTKWQRSNWCRVHSATEVLPTVQENKKGRKPPAPIGSHAHRPALRFASQAVEAKPCDVHVLGPRRYFQQLQDAHALACMVADPASVTRRNIEKRRFAMPFHTSSRLSNCSPHPYRATAPTIRSGFLDNNGQAHRDPGGGHAVSLTSC